METVNIIFQPGCFLRIDFFASSITILKSSGVSRIHVSTFRTENPLTDYARFRERVVQDDICSFASKSLTLRESVEAKVVIRTKPDFSSKKLWQFVKKVFPEYADLYPV